MRVRAYITIIQFFFDKKITVHFGLCCWARPILTQMTLGEEELVQKNDLRPRSGPVTRSTGTVLSDDTVVTTAVVFVIVRTVDGRGGSDCGRRWWSSITTRPPAAGAVFAYPAFHGGRRGHAGRHTCFHGHGAAVTTRGRARKHIGVVHLHDDRRRRTVLPRRCMRTCHGALITVVSARGRR